jgi:hypothetical protein
MDNIPTLPLRVSRTPDKPTWEGITDPLQLAYYLARILSVDPKGLIEFQEIQYSSVAPTGEESNQLWIKTGNPIGIGIPVGGEYKIFYQYPPNVALAWLVGAGDPPDFLRTLTIDEIEDLGLTDPDETKFKWVIFEV